MDYILAMEGPSVKRSENQDGGKKSDLESPVASSVSPLPRPPTPFPEQYSRFCLTDQPRELVLQIFDFCDPATLYAFRATSRRLCVWFNEAIREQILRSFPLTLKSPSGLSQVTIAIVHSDCFLPLDPTQDEMIQHVWQKWDAFFDPLKSLESYFSQEDSFRHFRGDLSRRESVVVILQVFPDHAPAANQQNDGNNHNNEAVAGGGVSPSFLSTRFTYYDGQHNDVEHGIEYSSCRFRSDLTSMKQEMRNQFSISYTDSANVVRAAMGLTFLQGSRVDACCRHSIYIDDVLSGRRLRSFLFRVSTNAGREEKDKIKGCWVDITYTVSFSHL